MLPWANLVMDSRRVRKVEPHGFSLRRRNPRKGYEGWKPVLLRQSVGGHPWRNAYAGEVKAGISLEENGRRFRRSASAYTPIHATLNRLLPGHQFRHQHLADGIQVVFDVLV